MQVITKDLKHGLVRVKPETQDDLWYLSQLIEAGDIVKGKAERKVRLGNKDDKSRAARKVFTATLKAEQITYDPSLGSLRVNGVMDEEHEHAPAGSHQSITVEPPGIITIIKQEWLSFHLELLREAQRAAKATIIIVVHDREEAYIARMKRSGYELLTHLTGEVEKKSEPKQQGRDFYSELAKAITEYDGRFRPQAIIVASPAFFAEDFIKTIKEESLRKRIVKASCSSVSQNAIDEVMKRDETNSVLQEQALARESKAVDALLERIAKKGNAAYGMKEVRTAAESGAVEVLLVTGGFIVNERENGKGAELDALMKLAEQAKGKIMILSSKNGPGSKLDGLGGIGALLRYGLTG